MQINKNEKKKFIIQIEKGISNPNLQIVGSEMKEEQKTRIVNLIVLYRGGEATPELQQLQWFSAEIITRL